MFETINNPSLQYFNSLKPPFKLPALPYGKAALTPIIDTATMNYHHDKHHQTYVEKLNEAVKEHKVKLPLLEIFRSASSQIEEVRNNAGGHWNHSFFWTLLNPTYQDNKIPKDLKAEIVKEFGNLSQFKEAFENAGINHFGSGYVWLILNDKGFLEITTTCNQNNPLMNTERHQGFPILTIDLWEHAYYLKYKNDRKAYLKACWKIINWDQVATYWSEAKTLNLKPVPHVMSNSELHL